MKTCLHLLILTVLFTPALSIADYHVSTSLQLYTTSNANAQGCYHAATIAARIHYTSRKEIENCTFALDYASLSLRDRAATYANRGIIYMALEEYQKAIQDYSTALKLIPDFGELYVNIGNVYFMGQVYDKAILEYSTAIEKNTSKSYIAYFNRGMAYEGLGDLDSAERDITTAMELLPEWSQPQLKLREILDKKARL